jgi:succinyl-CoA synthetase alpha subunit
MASAVKVVPNHYRDSVSLMQLSAALAKLPGIRRASVVMGSPSNLALLREADLFTGSINAGLNDLVIVIAGKSDQEVAAAIEAAQRSLDEQPAAVTGAAPGVVSPRSIAMALAVSPGANLALVSTPGDYAAAEAEKALRLGLNVMLFSDNVAVSDEVALKQLARERGLLVMGPDCGTAIVNGVPLAFANVVRSGDIGCIGASGTGLQQVTCLIDRLGAGISQAIGTGGHDLSADVGGITMLQGIEALAADDATKVMVLISKPPSPAVAERVLAAAARTGKPIVVNFIGARLDRTQSANLYAVTTLEDAARAAVALSRNRDPSTAMTRQDHHPALPKLGKGRRYVRGLYSGGTFCYEAAFLLGQLLGGVLSNAPVDPRDRLADIWTSRGHTVIDLGDDLFTRGRPHPMIDHRLRNERLLTEAADPEVGVILFDVVLGSGSHADPAGEMAATLRAARAAAPDLICVGFVCGTELDPQGLARQESQLREAGVVLADANAAAVRLAAAIVEGARG